MIHEKALWLRESMKEGKLEEAKEEKVSKELDITWAQYLGWRRQPTLPQNPMFVMMNPQQPNPYMVMPQRPRPEPQRP